MNVINQTELKAEISTSEIKNNVSFFTFKVTNDSNCQNIGVISVEFKYPLAKAFSTWNSKCGFLRSLQPNWKTNNSSSRIASGSPMQQIIGADGENVINISVLDAKTPIEIKTGVIEESNELFCRIDFFTIPISPFDVYETKIRIDTANKRYEESIKEVRDWWRSEGNYCESDVPESAKQPMYSTWYSFHQMLSSEALIKQCRMAKELGMETIIIDDGWQTEDNSRGYAYCGDWELAKSKIPDMRALVDEIHNVGMKVMIWFSVPFVGIHSKAYDRFKDKIINMCEDGYGCIDIRYEECRKYLIDIYKKAVKEWNFDGLKLDFIDNFSYPMDNQEDDRRDTESIEDAVELLLTEIYTELTKIKPDLCFEFRQCYIGPAVAKCGNMLRVMDCPADMIKNRMGSADIRFLSGKTPVHSDMLMWDLNDTPENAAMQIINSMFCVPQISVLLDKIPNGHIKMLKYYLSVWKKNVDTILNGKFKADNPECNYTSLSSELDNRLFAVLYANRLIEIDKRFENIVLINGTGKENLYLDVQNDRYNYDITDCMGNLIETGKISGLARINIPKSGLAILTAESL
ncbi:MAG: glycoside hydrolase family 36 protein [Eubacteriales bacterium]|nr:glycoside hydrolase family 36 protein [Eubacteriales bacterium]